MKYIKIFEMFKEDRIIVALVVRDFLTEDKDIRVFTEETLPEYRRIEYNNMKFHVGEIVYFKVDSGINRLSDSYVIDAVELPYSGRLNYHLDNDDDCLWTTEDTLIPEVEYNANKYNL